MRLFCEQWDGKGMPDGLKGNQIPHLARMLHMSATIGFFYWFGGRAAAQDVAEQRRGKAFDPEMANAFLSVSAKEDFWRNLEQESLWETVLSIEPGAPRYIGDDGLHDLALVLGDFVDMKTPHTAGHSRSVARVAERIARRMNLGEQEIVTVYRAGLIHDLGLAGVPAFTLARPLESLSDSEKEQVRLHPYHGERILSRLPGLEPIAALVGLHHERLDGQGFYRGLSGAQIPVGARALALADAFHERTKDRPGRHGLNSEEALAALKPSVGSQLDPDCFRALAEELGVSVPKPVRQQWPAGLTDREVEVLQVTVRGLTRRQMAERLFVSESTVRHHLESIYSKIGVSSRAGAVLFAVENDLVR